MFLIAKCTTEWHLCVWLDLNAFSCSFLQPIFMLASLFLIIKTTNVNEAGMNWVAGFKWIMHVYEEPTDF